MSEGTGQSPITDESLGGFVVSAEVPTGEFKTVLVIGNKTGDSTTLSASAHASLGAAVPGISSELANAIWDSIETAKDKSSTKEHIVQTAAGLVTVAFAALPTAISRHNSPTQAYEVRALARKYCTGSAPVLVVALLKSAEHALGVSLAVAAGCPAYSRKGSAGPSNVTVVPVAPEPLPEGTAERLTTAARSIRLTCALVDCPTNELGTTEMIAVAKNVQQRCKDAGKTVTITVIEGEALREKGFGGLYGVGKAAVRPPALVVLTFAPSYASATRGSVVFVGKGIVYDTGGLSIKTSENMPGMKRDMAGAAGLLGAFEAATLGGWCETMSLHCVLCLAENSVGPLATRPDDVHKLYSGKTVEINNTDAEGRLVLADGVAYAVKHLNPAYLFDMATLTGAQGIATGQLHAALYTNTDEMEKVVVASGRESGDTVHPLPYCPELFRKEFASAIADMKNSVKSRVNASSSCAGQFIANHMEEYVESGKAWAHIDMAYPSFTDERANGYGVALMLTILKNLGLKR